VSSAHASLLRLELRDARFVVIVRVVLVGVRVCVYVCVWVCLSSTYRCRRLPQAPREVVSVLPVNALGRAFETYGRRIFFQSTDIFAPKNSSRRGGYRSAVKILAVKVS